MLERVAVSLHPLFRGAPSEYLLSGHPPQLLMHTRGCCALTASKSTWLQRNLENELSDDFMCGKFDWCSGLLRVY